MKRLTAKRISLFLLGVVALLVTACGNKVDCDNAELCIKNVGTDTVHYCWGCNLYSESLPPGEQTCIKVGRIHGNRNNGSFVWVDFESDHGSYRIEVADCYVEKLID